MNHATASAFPENMLHGALELSKNSWVLAIQFPDRQQPSLYRINGGDTEDLMSKLTSARDRWAKISGAPPSIRLCYEAGYDAFWLARFLKAHGIDCLVVDAASLQVNRRGRRPKTDRLDVNMLLRAMIAWPEASNTSGQSYAFRVWTKKICVAPIANEVDWFTKEPHISIALKGCCLRRAFAATT